MLPWPSLLPQFTGQLMADDQPVGGVFRQFCVTLFPTFLSWHKHQHVVRPVSRPGRRRHHTSTFPLTQASVVSEFGRTASVPRCSNHCCRFAFNRVELPWAHHSQPRLFVHAMVTITGTFELIKAVCMLCKLSRHKLSEGSSRRQTVATN